MVKRNREIKQYGNSNAIKLEPADMKDLNLKVGELVDISDIFKGEEESDQDKHDSAEQQLTDCLINQKRKEENKDE